jgi:quercetin dioxygenase-like cupin family protein
MTARVSMALASTVLADIAASQSYAAPRRVDGVRWSRRVSPESYSIWMVISELDDGATIEWDDAHGDDGVYVISGALDVNCARCPTARCPTNGAVIVESGVACAARAVGVTTVVHCGAFDPAPPSEGRYGAPAAAGHGVHVVGDRGWFASGNRERVAVRWFADSTCATCRIALFHVWRSEGGVRDRSHTHTQDELIYVLAGSVIVGGVEHGPGTCLAIPAHTRYSLTSGDDGFAILNYRRDVSVQAYRPGEPEELEGALARGGSAVNDFR